jgi:hypothetical protein
MLNCKSVMRKHNWQCCFQVDILPLCTQPSSHSRLSLHAPVRIQPPVRQQRTPRNTTGQPWVPAAQIPLCNTPQHVKFNKHASLHGLTPTHNNPQTTPTLNCTPACSATQHPHLAMLCLPQAGCLPTNTPQTSNHGCLQLPHCL